MRIAPADAGVGGHAAKTDSVVVVEDYANSSTANPALRSTKTVFFNPDTHKAYKCDLCDGDPACARACPTDAIEYAEIDGAPWIRPWGELVDRNYQDVLAGAA